jgi:hypothetical protein
MICWSKLGVVGTRLGLCSVHLKGRNRRSNCDLSCSPSLVEFMVSGTVPGGYWSVCLNKRAPGTKSCWAVIVPFGQLVTVKSRRSFNRRERYFLVCAPFRRLSLILLGFLCGSFNWFATRRHRFLHSVCECLIISIINRSDRWFEVIFLLFPAWLLIKWFSNHRIRNWSKIRALIELLNDLNERVVVVGVLQFRYPSDFTGAAIALGQYGSWPQAQEGFIMRCASFMSLNQ